MKHLVFMAVTLMLAVPHLSAQLSITSLGRDGLLTWTNCKSSATYSIEVLDPASEGAFFMPITNLSSIVGTSLVMSVSVPIIVSNQSSFYRVIWTDAPSPFGIYDYEAFDDLIGFPIPIANGELDLEYHRNKMYGSWYIQNISEGLSEHPGDMGDLSGTFDGCRLRLVLSPSFDSFFILEGNFDGTDIAGTWYSTTFASSARGTFTATKRASLNKQRTNTTTDTKPTSLVIDTFPPQHYEHYED